nr:extracellular solute-binding protein [uncultured Clostridium sp.]
MKRRKTAFLMAMVMAAAAMSGCNSGKEPEAKPETTEAATAAASSEAAGGETKTDKPYEGVTLKYWVKLNGSVSSSVANLGETKWAKEVEEKTGIKLEFIHPTSGSEDEEFSVLVASGEYPDIIEYTWTKYSGGASAAISDGVILNLNDLMQSSAPNLTAILNDYPDIDKMVKTQEGDYYCFPFLRGLKTPNKTQFSSGMVLRKDILDKLGLSVPETIDDWDTVLRAYKNEGFEVPFTTRKEWMLDVWSPGFDNWGDFYVEDDVVKNGLMEDSRKEFLTKMNQWYEDGLIDRDYLVADKASCQTYFTTGKSAASYAPGGQGLGTYTQIMNEANPEITQKNIVSSVPVTKVKGKNAKFSKMNQIFDGSGSSATITTQCKNPEAAAWLLDWMYGPEGSMVNCFGIEGESYNMENGYPVYTDLITNNPDGLTMEGALALYTRVGQSGPLVQDELYIEQYYSQDNQREALDLWMKTDMGKFAYPPATISNEDSDKFSNIMSNVKTFSQEMEAKFIAGTASLDQWDEYVNQLKTFGIEDAIAMKQAAYDKYMAN